MTPPAALKAQVERLRGAAREVVRQQHGTRGGLMRAVADLEAALASDQPGNREAK